MKLHTLVLALGILVVGGCTALQVRQAVLDGNVVYSSLVPKLQVKVSGELTYLGREGRSVDVAIENVPTGRELGRSELFRFRGRDAGSGLMVTLTHGPMDMELLPGFQFEFLARSLDHESIEIGGREVQSAVLREGDFLYAKLRLAAPGTDRVTVTVDYWEPLDAADRSLFGNPKALSPREREMIAGIRDQAAGKVELVRISPGEVVSLRTLPDPQAGRPAPEPPTDQPVARRTQMWELPFQ